MSPDKEPPAGLFTILSGHQGAEEALGKFAAQWALVEMNLVPILGWLLGTNNSKAKIIFHNFISLSGKTDLFERLTNCYIQDGSERKELLDLFRQVRALNRTRNKYVHGMWAEDSNRKLVLKPNILPNSKDEYLVKSEPISAQAIQEEAAKAAKLAADILDFHLKKSASIKVQDTPIFAQSH